MEVTWNNGEAASMSKEELCTLDCHVVKKNVLVNVYNETRSNVTSYKDHFDKGSKPDCNESNILQPGSIIKPKVSIDNAQCLVTHLYGIIIKDITELNSYDDRNYFIKGDPDGKSTSISLCSPHGYVLKILNSLDSKNEELISAQTQLLLYLIQQNVKCPRPIPNAMGSYYTLETLNNEDYIVRLLEYIPGKLLHEVHLTNQLLFQSGEYLAKLVKIFKNFQHETYDMHQSIWQLQSVPKLKDFLHAVEDQSRKALIESIIESFETNILSQMSNFPTQIIHGDYNEQNIIVDMDENGHHKVIGIIDFGDTNKSPILFEISIALTYMILQGKNLKCGGIFLAGFENVMLLPKKEKPYLKYCVAARLAQSLVIGAYTYSLNPVNQYVLTTQLEGWKLLTELWTECFIEIDNTWQIAGEMYLKGK